MKQLTTVEIEKARLLKAARAAIRLKHALAADAEIYERLPALEASIDAALAAGDAFALDVQSILEDDAA